MSCDFELKQMNDFITIFFQDRWLLFQKWSVACTCSWFIQVDTV